MWYFAWILGTLLACAFGIVTALAIEHIEDSDVKEQ
ncbi:MULTISPECIES: cytochrome bd-I oxidase subunit CydX [Erwinia]|nr:MULTISPECIES: cytochrome bd-I oxidase subunit CydX [Erwinia]